MRILPIVGSVTFKNEAKSEVAQEEKKTTEIKDTIQERLEKELERKSQEAQVLLNKPQKYQEEGKKDGK